MMYFAILQGSPNQRVEGVAVADNCERTLFDLGQVLRKFSHALQEYIFRFDRYTIVVLRSLMPPAFCQMRKGEGREISL